ncbi:MAG: ribose 5-phosphate isomerase A [Chloroflexota bacterium]
MNILSPVEALKKQAAEKAVEQVRSGMVVGLGTGSSARYATMKIGELWQRGELTRIVGIPTGEATADLARQYGLPLATLDEYPLIDLAIDGADEISRDGLNLIKGLGGALLREKMIEMVTHYFIVVADDRKWVDRLGTLSPLPVEVVRFGWKFTARWLATLGCQPALRGGEAQPYVTDNGNFILDCTFPAGIADPVSLARALQDRPGVVEHGLFLGMAAEAIVAAGDGLQIVKK